MSRRDLYPPIEPYDSGMRPLDGLHTMYYEQCGRPDGVPVLFLHGGPGAGASPAHRRFFDPRHYRIVVFDQRGAGRSRPLGEVKDNTTQHLVDDIEGLRRHLGIERWHVFGGSWGSTLALAYAQAHPQRVMSLVLRGIFLMQPAEIAWFLYDIRMIFPEAWGRFVEPIPEAERDDLLAAYWRRLDDPDPELRLEAARRWSLYEGSCSTLRPNAEVLSVSGSDRHALGLARIEAHYFRHCGFDPKTRLIDRIDAIRHIPAVIVQGRYDMICPIHTADLLHRHWPEADYIVVADAGHSAMEPGIRAALVEATDRFAQMR